MSTGKTGGEQAPATKDTFLKSLDALKQVLLIDSPTKRLLNQDVDQRLYKERQEYETKINEQKKQIELLAKKLAESTAKAEREQSLRTSLERIEFATKELNSQLREVERSNSSTPLESKIAALEVDMKKRQADFMDEKTKFDQQMKALAAEKEDALNKKNEIEARLLGAQKVSLELTARLKMSEKSLIEEKAHHKDFVRSLQHANKILVQAMESVKDAKVLIEKEVSQSSHTRYLGIVGSAVPALVTLVHCLTYSYCTLTCIILSNKARFDQGRTGRDAKPSPTSDRTTGRLYGRK
jgi:chromosome segregation ATPase